MEIDIESIEASMDNVRHRRLQRTRLRPMHGLLSPHQLKPNTTALLSPQYVVQSNKSFVFPDCPSRPSNSENQSEGSLNGSSRRMIKRPSLINVDTMQPREQLQAMVAQDKAYLNLLKKRFCGTQMQQECKKMHNKEILRDRPEDLRRKVNQLTQKLENSKKDRRQVIQRMEVLLDRVSRLLSDQVSTLQIGSNVTLPQLNKTKIMEQRLQQLLKQNTQTTINIGIITQQNIKLRNDVAQLNRVLNVIHNEYAKKQAQCQKASKKLQELQQRYNEPCRQAKHKDQNVNFTKKQSIDQPFIKNNADFMSSSLYSFAAEEPSIVQLIQNNEYRDEYLTQLKNFMTKQVNLETSKLAQLIYEFCSKLYVYPSHSELFDHLSNLCQGLNCYEKYEETKNGSIRDVINRYRKITSNILLQEEQPVAIDILKDSSGLFDSDNQFETEIDMNTSITIDM